MRKRLTARTVQTLKPAAPKPDATGRRFVMDAEVAGLGIKVTQAGSRSYVLIKRFPGFKHPAPRQLGSCDAMSLEEAREKAREWLKLIARGIDPTAREREVADAAARKRANSFAAVFDDFAREKLAGERQGRNVARDMRKEFLSVWAKRPIADITDQDVLGVIRAVKARSPSSARNAFGYISRFFDWAIEQRAYGVSQNPCAGLKPARIIGEKPTRSRVLTDDELFAFWRATGRTAYPFGPLYRLLLLTGLRLNECADATWSEFDLRNRTWVVPSVRMKGRDGRVVDHVVPITKDIAAILESLPRFKTGDFLFSTTFGETPVWLSSLAKKRLDARMRRTLRALARRRGERATLPPWVNHDLRRTLRTGLSKLRVDRDIREVVLGHVRPGVEAVYDRHDYFDEKRDALERWAAHVAEIAAPSQTSNVVRLRG